MNECIASRGGQRAKRLLGQHYHIPAAYEPYRWWENARRLEPSLKTGDGLDNVQSIIAEAEALE
jgi:hypothetical protein